MRVLTEELHERLLKELPDNAHEEQMSEAITAAIERLVAVVQESLRENAPRMLADQRALTDQFAQRTLSRWEAGFDALETLIVTCTEAGEAFNEENRPAAAVAGDAVLEVCVRLHARGCLIAREIYCLLRNGFADGGLARWRALHETTVTALFVKKHGHDCACRYHDHQIVHSHKGAQQHKQYEDRLQEKAPDDEELTLLKDEYADVVAKYGKEFKNEYGWADDGLRTRANFSLIEKDVELDHWRPYYKWACQNVHAGAKGLYRSLGLPGGSQDAVLAGPSDAGMTNPAHQTAISLTQLTTNLLTRSPSVDDLVLSKILLMMEQEVGTTFLEVERTG